MSLITTSDFTFTAEQNRALAGLLKERTFRKPELSLIHTVVEPIVTASIIPTIGRFGLLGKKSEGCDPVADTASLAGSEKQWNPANILIFLKQCWRDLDNSLWVYGMKKGVERPDLRNTDFDDLVSERLGDAQWEAILRLIWFGDTDAETVNGTPAGNLTNGTQEDYFTPIDGFWKQIFAIVAADSARRVEIAQNAEATYANQAFDSTDTTNMVATGYLSDLVYNSDFRMRDQGGMILTTQSLADQYARELRSQGADSSYKRIEAGYNTLSFEGTTLIALPFWDRIIRTYFDNGTKYHLPHRALYVSKDNLLVGTDSDTAYKETKVIYDEITDWNYWKSRFMLDAKIVEDTMIQAAY